MGRTHGPTTAQGTSQSWAEKEAGKLFWTPILEWGPQAQPGAGMGRIVRGPQGLPAGRALSLPHPTEIQALTHPMWLVLREISNSRSTCVDS